MSNSLEMTPFSDLMAAMRQSSTDHSIVLPDDWLQGRTAYGGLSAALCLEATKRSHEDLPPLRSAHFCFIGPAMGALNMTSDVLRKGKSTTIIGSDLTGDSGLAVRSTFCFGAARTSTHEYQSIPMPNVPKPDECTDYYVWPDRPNFMRHFEGRLASGALPRTTGVKPEMAVWLRHRDLGDESNLTRLLALADALPPPALVLSKSFIQISTMTSAIEFLDDHPFTSTGWWLVQAIADTSREGYSSQSIVIWNSDGKPVLTSRQNVAIFG